ncbi:YraN family protein [Kutzneria sp. CA-103260]|uniref:YraN family protein n=1 Tax=Kutzneria sp. CA-103260 TaxID=2802641 RepID=UPI001BA82ECA|nr:YraN family protein [Kutzneria sp. CA-103260]QUQ71507.1 endonuclease [Kutzneria sp. CA-103260]
MTRERCSTTPSPAELGRLGEELATLFLEEQGLVVLSRNWRCPEGELDIVATDGGRLVVCEVKTRSSTTYGKPAEAVDYEKATRIRRLTHRWRAAHNVAYCDTRFDLISILWPGHGPARLEHLRGAF